MNTGGSHSFTRLLHCETEAERGEKKNKVWEGERINASLMLQAPLLSPHLKFAMKQEHEPGQTLFSGKGQLGNVLVCVRVELELWISVVLRTQSAHSDCTLSLLLGDPAVSTDESLVTARKAMPCSPPFCFQYSRPGFFCAQRYTTN